MRSTLFPLLALTLVAQTPSEIRMQKDLKYLAGPELKGRGNGDPGLEKAAAYLEKAYKDLGLKTTLQHFGFVREVVRKSGLARLGQGEGEPTPLVWGRDVEAVGWSADARLTKGPLVFLGFGLGLPDHDDRAGLDLKDKVALIARQVPNLPVFQKVSRMDLALLGRIQKLARAGVAAVVVLEDEDAPAKLKREEGPLKVDIPVVSLPSRALRPLGSDLKVDLEALRADGKPRSRELGAWLSLDLELERKESKVPNLAALLPGRDPKLREEHIVVGGHLDHLGLGERHSMLGERGRGQVHAGADDNASGTAMVLELARVLKAQPPKRSVVFLHMGGEEEGLLGSAHWVQNPTVPLPTVKFMVNFDMVGRLDSEKPVLQIGGLGSPKSALARARTFAPKGLGVGEDLGAAVGGSDHMSFSAARIPTFFFFTGTHGDYHKPSDSLEKLNVKGMVAIADMAREIVKDLADSETLPPWDPETAKLPSRGRGGGGARIAFGTIPDFKENPSGFRISGTSPGSTAETLGMKAGDILTTFGERPIKNIYDFMEALAAFNPGDKVVVKWIREGQTLQAEAILKGR